MREYRRGQPCRSAGQLHMDLGSRRLGLFRRGRLGGRGDGRRGDLHRDELPRRCRRVLNLCRRGRDDPRRGQPGALDPSADQPLAQQIDVQAMGQRDGRYRCAGLLALSVSTCVLNTAPCTRLLDLGCKGAHLFELVGTIVRGASARFKTGRPDAHREQFTLGKRCTVSGNGQRSQILAVRSGPHRASLGNCSVGCGRELNWRQRRPAH
jgi:hypothetical protein